MSALLESLLGDERRAKCRANDEYIVNDGDPHQRGLRILVVDDNHDMASTTSTLLELEGHRTGVAHNGLEAVREATNVHYDAVLLDLGMPIMDGFEAAAVLGQLSPAPALIACSAWDDAATRSRTAALGFSMHLRKPFSLQVLKAALRDISSASAK